MKAKKRQQKAETKNNELKMEFTGVRASDQLGQVLQRIRKQMNLTQMDLAKLARVRQGTISKIESGVKTNRMEPIFAICNALGLELAIRARTKRNITDVFN